MCQVFYKVFICKNMFDSVMIYLRAMWLQKCLQKDIRMLKPLHVVAKYLAILPNLDLQCMEECKFRHWYSLLLATLFLLAFAYSTYGKIVSVTEYFAPTVWFTDLASDTTLTISNVGAIIGLSMVKGRSVVKLLKKFVVVDVELKDIDLEVKYPALRFYIEFVICQIAFLVYFFYNMYVWTSSLGWGVYKYFILRDLQNYHIYILSLVLRNYALAISYRVQLINKVLMKHCCSNNIEDEKKVDLKYAWSVRRVRRIYTDLSDLLDKYNDIFGWHFVPLYGNILVNMLTPVNLAVVYGSGEKDIAGQRFGLSLVVLCIIWGCFPLIMGTTVFEACERTTSEFVKTRDICYSLVQKLPIGNRELLLKQELQDLAQQSANKNAEISAAGFFSVNFNLLFSLVGSVSSYLIVLLQFNH